MGERDDKLQDLGYSLDKTGPLATLIEPLVIDGSLVFISGHIPNDGDQLVSKGKVPSQVSLPDAQKAAALCAANCLRALRQKIGSLDRVRRILRITGYVNADATFTDEHLVINGASQLLLDVFGEAGRHARTAVGMAQLPLGCSTEVEMIVALHDEP